MPAAGRLTVVHTDFHRGWGGQINRVLAECRGLAGRGHAVVLAVPGDGRPAATARAEGIAVFGDVRFRPKREALSLIRDALTLRRLFSAYAPDIVNSHGSQDTWAAVLARRLMPRASRPVQLYTRHNTKRVRNTAVNRWLFGRGLDGLIVVAPEVKERFRGMIDAGVLDEARIPAIHSPLRADMAAPARPPDRARVRREVGAGEDSILAGTVARLVPDKGQEHLIDALAILAPDWPRLSVVLAGDGDEAAALEARARRLGLADRVHFLGYRDDVLDVYAALDIAVLPAVDCDASSGMIKEALASRIPVVATEIGAARPLTGDGKYGIVVPPRDPASLAEAIATIARELPDWRRRAAEGERFVRATFTHERMIDELDAAYRAALARAGRG
ncbi:MAG: glycosyltransferase family 4 protein [Acidobacteria bacterium]|jgi:glycosyltransferase involved in cell wall biosynthesis|nr:glycosyltransferase family 4 protein [Acidobacteriota bacterium]